MFFLFCFLIIAISLSSAAEVISPAEFYANEVILFASCSLLVLLIVVRAAQKCSIFFSH